MQKSKLRSANFFMCRPLRTDTESLNCLKTSLYTKSRHLRICLTAKWSQVEVLIMLWLAFSLLTIKAVHATETQKLENGAKVLEMLVECGGSVASLRNDLKTMKDEIERLSKQQATGTYTRWGRSSCPPGATTVYDGFTAGSYYTHQGAATNHMCLSKKPKYHYHYKKPRYTTFIYGAEYETHDSIWDKLVNHDIPCVVCHVPRSSIIMIAGRDDCPDNFKLEYGGYLMAGRYKHQAGTEYLCFDSNSMAAEYSSQANRDGALFYFVEAVCGSLKCRPYESGTQITCAVCSYSP